MLMLIIVVISMKVRFSYLKILTSKQDPSPNILLSVLVQEILILISEYLDLQSYAKSFTNF